MSIKGSGKSSKVEKTSIMTKDGYNFDAIGQAQSVDESPLRHLKLGKKLGIVFPYTPSLNLQGGTAYGVYDLTHSNYQPHFYSSTQNQQMTLGFNLTATTVEEANYMLGFMWFLRTITKMNFGKNDKFAGMPPPVLHFNSYGDFQFKNVPVVIRNYSYDQTDNYDYVDTDHNTQVPTFLTGFVDIVTQYTPGQVLNNFTLQDFATGKLVKSGKGFI